MASLDNKHIQNKIIRSASYLKADNETIFFWMHELESRNKENVVVILCPPLGQEYMSTHRSLRHLSDTLALNGYQVVRFDYTDTGDSADTKLSIPSLEQCINNIVLLCDFFRNNNQNCNICCAGFGLGASIAYLAAERVIIDTLILWEPCIRGSRYIRELKALSGILTVSESNNDIIEAAGLTLTPVFENELNKLNLELEKSITTENLLWLYRDDKKINTNFEEIITSNFKNYSIEAFSGFFEMVTYPTDTVVPIDALKKQLSFLNEVYKGDTSDKSNGRLIVENSSNYKSSYLTKTLEDIKYIETPLNYGKNNFLFGILTEPKSNLDKSNVMVIFINCGSEHHVGPHRMYTNFARKLSEQGIASFRIDIEGIGDSISRGRNSDNNAYSPVAMEDIRDALVKTESLGYHNYILTGICAGAYHAFKALSELFEFNITSAILVNPLVFHWRGKEVETQHNEIKLQSEANRYRSNIINAKKWKKLLSGQVNIINTSKLIIKFFTFKVRNIGKNYLLNEENIVANNLRDIAKNKRNIQMIISENDPGYEILKSETGSNLKKYLDQHCINVDTLKNADHGLSKHYMRKKLYDKFEAEVIYINNNL